jgi:1-acyl-sn-glycerol-3-phosphate acyltransferase
VLAVTVPPLRLALALARGPHAVQAVSRWWCRAVLRLTGAGPRVRGVEHVPRGAVVLVANHASYLDVAALVAALPRDLCFVAKRELLGAPVVGTVLRRGGHLTVDRLDLSRSVADAERVTAALRGGAAVCIFPEGTFVRQPGLLPFRLGAFKAAVEAGCPVVPVAIRGTREVLPADTWRPRPGCIEVAATVPISPAGEGWREMVRLRDLARAAIAAVSEER